jgi:hypothetical protein
MRRLAPLALVVPTLLSILHAQAPELPHTRPERTRHAETSSAEDVATFLDACVRLSHGDRLTIRVAGKSHEGRALLLVKAALPDPAPRLRALIVGNIHAGEVEGKEAVQELCREIAAGEHEAVLRHCDVWFLPIYNVDGNEAAASGNRPGQNGPEVVGQRANAQGLDLNRDFVKAEAPETRVLLRLFHEIDPDLFVDLHTTNGSDHGYHLTYAPSLSPNVDRGIQALSRALLDDATARLDETGVRTFDYGNFETHGGVRGFYTYDHRARYGVNCFALRNRIAVLSEAYSYDDFATRIASTKAFVLALLRGLVARKDEVRQAAEAADRIAADATTPRWFGFETTFGPAEQLPIRLGDVVEEGARRVRRGERGTETMAVHRRFQARHLRALPRAWAIVAPSPEVVQRLQAHGITFHALGAPQRIDVQRFAVAHKRKPKRPYQGHQELVLVGAWEPAAPVDLPLGTIVIDGAQRLSRLAATLLEPESEDSLSTWNFFEAATGAHYPVLRLDTLPR